MFVNNFDKLQESDAIHVLCDVCFPKAVARTILTFLITRIDHCDSDVVISQRGVYKVLMSFPSGQDEFGFEGSYNDTSRYIIMCYTKT